MTGQGLKPNLSPTLYPTGTRSKGEGVILTSRHPSPLGEGQGVRSHYSPPHEPHPLPLQVDLIHAPACIGPGACVAVVALGDMFPPRQFIRRSRQFAFDDAFDLRKGQPHLVLTCRQVGQMLFKRTVFAGHTVFLSKPTSPRPSPNPHTGGRRRGRQTISA